MMMNALKELAKSTPLLRSVFQARYDKRFAENTTEQLYRGIFKTAREASASFDVKKLGYDNAESAGMYESLMGTIEHYDYPVLFWLKKLLSDDPNSMLRGIGDYGGHVGIKYYAYGHLLGPLPRWTVHDVPAAMARGKEIALERGMYGLRFADSFAGFAGCGALLSLGALQYLEPTLASSLSSLPATDRPRHVIINTTAFTEEDEFYTLNSIGTSYCPYKIQNTGAFIGDMLQAGYAMTHVWENPGRKNSVPFQDERADFRYLGMHFETVLV